MLLLLFDVVASHSSGAFTPALKYQAIADCRFDVDVLRKHALHHINNQRILIITIIMTSNE